MLEFPVSSRNKRYLLIEVQISMSSMLHERIRSQMEYVSNVPQHEHPFSCCLNGSQMLKTKMYVISPSIVLFQKTNPRNESESYSYRLLFTSLWKIRVFYQGKHPMGLGSWVGSSSHGRPMPITQHLSLAYDRLVLFQTSSQQLKHRVLFIQVNGLCDLKHINGGSSDTNLSLGSIGDINLIRVRQCLFTPSIFLNTHDQV